MKASTGTAALTLFIVIVVGIIVACITASNIHTKAYKAKDEIISTIDSFYNKGDDCLENLEVCLNQINQALKNKGYAFKMESCPSREEIMQGHFSVALSNKNPPMNVYDLNGLHDTANHGYCIYEIKHKPDETYNINDETEYKPDETYNINDETEYNYLIITYAYFKIPMVDHYIYKTPVYGETRTYEEKDIPKPAEEPVELEI